MTKVKIFLVCSFLIIQPLLSHACGNEYQPVKEEIPITKGKLRLHELLFHGENGILPYWYQGFGDHVVHKRDILAEAIKGRSKSNEAGTDLKWETLEKALNANVEYRLLSDYAWHTLRIGNKENAVRLLEALYAKYPDEYNIVANLGTAYELTGKNEMALMLIRKAVAINPASHYGSEWIHVRILEQKVKAKPDYRQILRLHADKDFTAWLSGENYKQPFTPDSLMIQLAYQLHERISFVPDPDPIVGQLVFDFADLTALSRSISAAKPFYKYAVTYDIALEPKEKERILIGEGEMAQETSEVTEENLTANRIRKNPVSDTTQWIIIAVVAVLVGGIALYFVSKRKNSSV